MPNTARTLNTHWYVWRYLCPDSLESGDAEKSLPGTGRSHPEHVNGDAEANERFIVYKEKLKGLLAIREDGRVYQKGKSSPASRSVEKILPGRWSYGRGVSTLPRQPPQRILCQPSGRSTEEMISQAAPAFALKDLSGNTVSD